VPSEENVRRFFPTPAGRLAVTIQAPTRVSWLSRVDPSDAQPAASTALKRANKTGIRVGMGIFLPPKIKVVVIYFGAFLDCNIINLHCARDVCAASLNLTYSEDRVEMFRRAADHVYKYVSAQTS
jgi:hypothetical protein